MMNKNLVLALVLGFAGLSTVNAADKTAFQKFTANVSEKATAAKDATVDAAKWTVASKKNMAITAGTVVGTALVVAAIVDVCRKDKDKSVLRNAFKKMMAPKAVKAPVAK